MSSDRLIFSGTPKKYYQHLKQALMRYGRCFKDAHSSILSDRQANVCFVHESIIRFAKVNKDGKVEYLFHYDTIVDIPNHPDHHLQFEYDHNVPTPRFRLLAYESVEDILQMIVRDKII